MHKIRNCKDEMTKGTKHYPWHSEEQVFFDYSFFLRYESFQKLI